MTKKRKIKTKVRRKEKSGGWNRGKPEKKINKSICLGSFTLGVLMVSTFVVTSNLKIKQI